MPQIGVSIHLKGLPVMQSNQPILQIAQARRSKTCGHAKDNALITVIISVGELHTPQNHAWYKTNPVN